MPSAEFLPNRQRVTIKVLYLPQVISKVKAFGCLNLNHSQGKFSRRQIDDIFLIYPRQFMQNVSI